MGALPTGPLSVSVQASYLDNLTRAGLRLSGGTVGGTVSANVSTTVAPSSGGAFDTTATYEVSQLAVPLPSVMPSYNQIGFDSLHYLLGTVQAGTGQGIAWMVGAKIPAAGQPSVVDPATQAIFPLTYALSQDLATFTAAAGLVVQVTNLDLPFQSFRLALGFAQGGATTGLAELGGSAVCAKVPTYGPYLEELGLCNPQTDVVRVLGAANTARRTDIAAPPAAGTPTFASTGTAITATVSGSQVKISEHLAALLVVDGSTGLPVTLEYGTGTTRTANADGTLATVSVPTKGATLPATMNAFLMIDTTAAAQGAVATQ
jgi:hypothetical protein